MNENNNYEHGKSAESSEPTQRQELNSKKRIATIGVFISSLAMLIAAVGIISGASVSIFIGTTAVFCANVAIYASIKKKENKE